MIGFQCQPGKGPEAHRSLLRKSSLCQCGCKKVVHATRSIVEWSAWSHRSLAAGTWPTQRHDGAEGGALHTGTTLAWSGCASTCGFLARANQNDPCFKCCCVRRKWRALAGMNMLVWSSSKKTTNTYIAATPALTASSLDDDRDSRGAHGRAPCIDLPRLGLHKRDRLEPSGEVLVRRG